MFLFFFSLFVRVRVFDHVEGEVGCKLVFLFYEEKLGSLPEIQGTPFIFIPRCLIGLSNSNLSQTSIGEKDFVCFSILQVI